MSQADENSPPPPAEPASPPPERAPGAKPVDPSERWVKRGFLAVFLVAAAIILYFQLRGTDLPDTWGRDLPAALAKARSADPPKNVVVFVKSFPAGENDNWMVTNTLKKNDRFLKSFVRVQLTLDRDAGWAKKYGVTTTPTMLVLSADGERFHRHSGRIGEVDFRKQFLKAPLISVSGAQR